MASRKGVRGETTWEDGPNWQPLVDLLGRRLPGDFMWMFAVQLKDGMRLEAYKHIDTRRYIHLDCEGHAYYFRAPDGYVPTAAADQLTAVFATLPGLGGVTEGQVLDSWAAVDRLRNAEKAPRAG